MQEMRISNSPVVTGFCNLTFVQSKQNKEDKEAAIYKFQWPQEDLNCISLTCKVFT